MGKRAPLVGDPIIAANIKRALQIADISPAELAQRLHVTRQAVSQWLRAQTTPSTKRQAQIAEQLQVSVESLRQSSEVAPIRVDSELEAMEKVYQLLRNQPPSARRRILNWLSDRFDQSNEADHSPSKDKR